MQMQKGQMERRMERGPGLGERNGTEGCRLPEIEEFDVHAIGL